MRMLIEALYPILYRTEPDTDEGRVSAVETVRVVDDRRYPSIFAKSILKRWIAGRARQ
jgi:hypothetical protein